MATQPLLTVAPYSSWKSPITADVIAGASKQLSGIVVDSNGRLTWLESRPEKQGLFAETNRPRLRRTSDQLCHGVFDPRFNRIVTIREIAAEAVEFGSNGIHEPRVLIGGNDFYAFLRINPSGKRMAWIERSHPYMPWDKTELWVGYVSESGAIEKHVYIAGSDPSICEAPTEPKWENKHFITDRKSGFWNLDKWSENDNTVASIYSLDGEFSIKLWVYGTNSYEFVQCREGNNLIDCSYRQKGWSYLGILDESQSTLSLIDIPFTDLDNIVQYYKGHGWIFADIN